MSRLVELSFYNIQFDPASGIAIDVRDRMNKKPVFWDGKPVGVIEAKLTNDPGRVAFSALIDLEKLP